MPNSFLIQPGRVEAETKEDATEKIKQAAAGRGLKIIGPIKPYPCPVQCLSGTWWEHYTRVEVIA